ARSSACSRCCRLPSSSARPSESSAAAVAMLRRLQTLTRAKASPPRAVQRDTFELTLDDGRVLEIERRRDPRARRIKLSVSDRGARLTMPPRASLVAGCRFAHDHREWLAAQL